MQTPPKINDHELVPLANPLPDPDCDPSPVPCPIFTLGSRSCNEMIIRSTVQDLRMIVTNLSNNYNGLEKTTAMDKMRQYFSLETCFNDYYSPEDLFKSRMRLTRSLLSDVRASMTCISWNGSEYGETVQYYRDMITKFRGQLDACHIWIELMWKAMNLGVLYLPPCVIEDHLRIKEALKGIGKRIHQDLKVA